LKDHSLPLSKDTKVWKKIFGYQAEDLVAWKSKNNKWVKGIIIGFMRDQAHDAIILTNEMLEGRQKIYIIKQERLEYAGL